MKIDPFTLQDECIKVYDPTIKEQIGSFATYGKAEKYLGLSAKVIRNAVISKTRRFSPFLNKEVAIRIGARTDKDKEFIRKFDKHSPI